jgi:hypothetical protein
VGTRGNGPIAEKDEEGHRPEGHRVYALIAAAYRSRAAGRFSSVARSISSRACSRSWRSSSPNALRSLAVWVQAISSSSIGSLRTRPLYTRQVRPIRRSLCRDGIHHRHTHVRICSRLSRSPFFMLMINSQHAGSPPLQAHPALETCLASRLMLRYTCYTILVIDSLLGLCKNGEAFFHRSKVLHTAK